MGSLIRNITRFFAATPGRWRIHRPWLFVPVAVLVSTLLGVACVALAAAVIPADVGVVLAIGGLLFPLLGGAVLAGCMASHRRWRAVGQVFVASLGIGLISGLINWWSSL
ncbi:MAG: hypothetical protein AAGF12_23005 [Myxococcota bacterium]